MEINIITYWPQFVMLGIFIAGYAVQREKIKSLEEKVRVLFELWNNR